MTNYISANIICRFICIHAGISHMRILQPVPARARRFQFSEHWRADTMLLQRSQRKDISTARIPVSIHRVRAQTCSDVLVGCNPNRLLEKQRERWFVKYCRTWQSSRIRASGYSQLFPDYSGARNSFTWNRRNGLSSTGWGMRVRFKNGMASHFSKKGAKLDTK